MSGLLWSATGLTRAWTATYTRGLPAAIRTERIEEIDADLWDHRTYGQFQKHPATGTGLEILGRLALGMPADVLWRIETGRSPNGNRRNSVNSSLGMRIGFCAAVLLLLAFTANGIAIVLGAGEYDSRAQQVTWGLVFAALPLISVAGVWLAATRPRLGVTLVVLGVVFMSLIMFWMAFLILPIGSAVIAFTIRRSGLRFWPINRSPAGAA